MEANGTAHCIKTKKLNELSSADFFQNQLFSKILSEIPSECQTVGIQTKPDILSGLIWVQTVCKGYQQMTLGGKELKKTVCLNGT